MTRMSSKAIVLVFFQGHLHGWRIVIIIFKLKSCFNIHSNFVMNHTITVVAEKTKFSAGNFQDVIEVC